MPTEHIFATGAEAATDIAARIATLLSDATAQRGVATLAVSGGRSPRPVLEALSRETVIVSHGGVARAVLALVGAVPPAKASMVEIWQGKILVVTGGRADWI